MDQGHKQVTIFCPSFVYSWSVGLKLLPLLLSFSDFFLLPFLFFSGLFFFRSALHYELKVNTFAILSPPQKETKQEIKCRSCWLGSRLTREFIVEKISAEWLVRKWCTCYCWYMSFHNSTFSSFGLWKWGGRKLCIQWIHEKESATSFNESEGAGREEQIMRA